jgi:hypothetical protein
MALPLGRQNKAKNNKKMGALLESGLVGNIGLKHLKVIKEDTINKWDKLGFLEGLKETIDSHCNSYERT